MNNISCEQSPKERIKQAWKSGMLYRFYQWFNNKAKKENPKWTSKKNLRRN